MATAVEPSQAEASFDAATALAPDGRDGVLTGAIDGSWWGGVGPHGGYLAAILARAAASAAGARQTMRSLTVHYLEAARQGPFEVTCSAERSTRTTTTVALRLSQDGRPILAGLAALVAGRSCPELDEPPMPMVPPWREVEVSNFLTDRGVTDVAPAFATQLEYRHCLGPAPLSGGAEALTGGWLRLREERPLDAPAAALMKDAWWPAVWSRLRAVPRTPTIDLTVHFRRPLQGTTEPVLALFRSRLGHDGFIDEEGELWSADGRLLVQSRQLAVLLAPPDAA